jgi:hypothetical protein
LQAEALGAQHPGHRPVRHPMPGRTAYFFFLDVRPVDLLACARSLAAMLFCALEVDLASFLPAFDASFFEVTGIDYPFRVSTHDVGLVASGYLLSNITNHGLEGQRDFPASSRA